MTNIPSSRSPKIAARLALARSSTAVMRSLLDIAGKLRKALKTMGLRLEVGYISRFAAMPPATPSSVISLRAPADRGEHGPQAPGAESIRIRGARTHNLKNVSLDLPRNRLVVITGLSGSGKSSLAFDTIYAEGQRRYLESLSAYAR